MSQHNFSIPNEAGASFRGDVNNALQALASQSSGTLAPATSYPYQIWADTTSNLVKRRNAANTGWIVRDTLLEAFVIARASNTVMAQSDYGRTLVCTGSFTQTFPALSTLADGWWAEFINGNAPGGGVITFGTAVDGATRVLNPGESCVVNCNGSSLYSAGRASAYAPMPRGHISALTLSRNATITKLDVAAGKCRDSTDAFDIVLASAITAGAIASPWAAGSIQNKLDTGAVANSTWYHVYAIRKDADGSGDWLFSLSASAPTMPSGYTYFRRIGAIRTDGTGNILAFTQDGDYFSWNALFAESTTSLTTTAADIALSGVPGGVNVLAQVQGFVQDNSSNNAGMRLYAKTQADVAIDPSQNSIGVIGATAVGSTGVRVAGEVLVRTDTSATIRGIASALTLAVDLRTRGWFDRRGRDN